MYVPAEPSGTPDGSHAPASPVDAGAFPGHLGVFGEQRHLLAVPCGHLFRHSGAGRTGQGIPGPRACLVAGGHRRRDGLIRFPLQLYTLSQDGALCVWQCDTPPEGLRLKAPTGWRAELLQGAEAEEEDDEEGEEETTVRGKAAPAAEEQQGKVKYSRLAK